MGTGHSAVKQKNGNIYTWGNNEYWQLGYGIKFTYTNTPIEILKNVKYIDFGGSERRTNSAVIREDGSAWVWGRNTYRNLGVGVDKLIVNIPTKLMDSISDIIMSEAHSALLKQDGSLWLMGNSGSGEIGMGKIEVGSADYINRAIPIKVMDDVLSVSLTSGRSGAIKKDGSLWMWGANTSGQIGNGTSGNDRIYSPLKIMDNVVSVGLADFYTMALKKDESLWGWGNNSYGELGDGTTVSKNTPVKIMNDVVSYDLTWKIGAGSYSGAIKTDGSLWMWGDNYYRQLGFGEEYYYTTPKMISFEMSDEEILPPSGDAPTFKIDFKNQQLIIPTNTNSLFFLGVEDKKGIVKSYELFEVGATTTKIPLSNFATTKEWKLKLYGNVDNTPVDITLAAGAKKVKTIYTPTESTVSSRIKFIDNGAEVDLSELEYRTAGSQWLDASALSIDQLDAYAVYGNTLTFRIKAVEDTNPYSAEAKMKIPKLANAPKVTMNYSKLTAKFPAGSEYRTKHSGAWTASPTTTVNLDSITNIATTDLYLEVRKAAVDGKAASKIGIINATSQQAGPTISESTGVLLITNEKANGATTSIKIKNTSTEKEIEYVIVAKDTDVSSINTVTQKWKKLMKGAEVSIKKAESDGKVIIARYVAITAKNETPQFASKITKFGEIIWEK